MPMHEVTHVSINQALQGTIAILLGDANLGNCQATREGLMIITTCLSRYQEEGKDLFPKVILTTNLQQLQAQLPQCEVLRIGHGPIAATTYRECLKRCAPLAVGNWYVYVERNAKAVVYGLVRSGASPFSPTPEQKMAEMPTDAPAIVIKQIADGVVEAAIPGGSCVCVTFTGHKVTEDDRRPKLHKLYKHITENCECEIQLQLVKVLDRIFETVVQHRHGTLAIVTDPVVVSKTRGLKDGIWLPEPLDLAKRVETEVVFADSESSAAIYAAEDIVVGMLMSDGITVFNTKGCVVGFNVFAKPSNQTERNVVAKTGGARRRAFELLRLWLECPVLACFMLSQDGSTQYEERR
ncbi:MAG: hypothetical protein NT018_04305 [Armatimonadetes bacterium]|nr:hypothetical protein [Armatimonadota bacterium]